jgi:hypothetical protein
MHVLRCLSRVHISLAYSCVACRCQAILLVPAVLQDAVAKLSENMALAGFPVIRMSGLFQLPCVPCPVFLYNVVEAVGRPLRRTFPGLRKIKQIWPQPPEMKVRCEISTWFVRVAGYTACRGQRMLQQLAS